MKQPQDPEHRVSSQVRVISRGEPSDAAWRRSGDIAARILMSLAERDAERAALAGEPAVLRGPFLTTKQAADYCGMPTQSLYNRLSKGTGPKVHKHGARNKFLLDELDEWMTTELTR